MNHFDKLLRNLAGAAASIAIAMLGACASTEKKETVIAPPAKTLASNTAPAMPGNLTPAMAPSAQPVPQAVGKSVYFDFDSAAISDQATPVLRGNAEILARGTQAIRIEGNCDERGSREYNIALGAKRAEEVKRALTVLGVKPARIETVSYGKEKPRAQGHDEAAWAQNRRDDILYH